ncbi:MAG: MFS transporter [Chloroflexota bacterium]
MNQTVDEFDVPQVTTEKLSHGTKLAYGVGDLGTAIVASLKGFFFLFFLTDVARMSPAAAGSILMLAKIWDAVNDPFVGWLSDRTRTRWGRRRPWILFGAIPFGLLFYLLWLTPPLNPTGLFTYYLVIALLGDIAYTVVNVPYAALTPELTRDYDERTSLNSYRFSFSVIGSLVAATCHPFIVDQFDNIRVGYAVSAAIWAIVATVPNFIVVAFTRERPENVNPAQSTNSTQQDAIPFLAQIGIAFQNRPYRYVIGIYLLSWFVLQLIAVIIVYYLTYYLRSESLIPWVLLSIQGSAFVFLFVWGEASKRFDKRFVYMMGAGIWLLVQLVLYFVTPELRWLVIPLAVMAGSGVATAYLVPWSMMPDVIEFDEWETGQRREGIFYGFMVFLQKACLALALYFVGLTLEWAGYLTPTEAIPNPIQPESALTAIRLLMGPIPAVVLAASIILVFFYPITRQKHQEIRAALASRGA